MFVYVIVNSETMKIYVGKTISTDLSLYLKKKIRDAGKGRYKGRSRLFSSMQKHPSTVWSIHPLFKGKTEEKICEHEKLLIKSLKAQHPDVGYNICDGGQGVWSEEVRAKALAKMQSPEFRAAQSLRMKESMNTPEAKANVSQAQQKRFADPEKYNDFRQVHNSEKTKKAHSMAAKQWLADPAKKKNCVDQAHSESATKKRSASLKAWNSDPANVETRRIRGKRISESKAGVFTEAMRSAQVKATKAAAEATRKRFQNPAERLKQSELMKAVWAKKKFNGK